ncbi:SOS response-associated peptidase [Enterococcus sp. ZJ1622]|uniref:SOS response-associated peptidase n=1 Tax=Enterococcus sp. ZJ1622 TaxID=2709401 RepID=UPI0013E9F499|nr:SOS response-associated peptidase [Enterococcus sp. ZJ1622]
MCGRYFFDLESEKLRDYYEAAKKSQSDPSEKIASGEVFPSTHVVTLGADKEKKIVAGRTKWGFEGFKKGQLMINARAETVEEKKTFRKPFTETRCVFPMSGFYEWNTEKEKFLFTDKDDILYVGGFYRIHRKEEGFVTESIILTTAPNRTVASVHDRMPLILESDQIEPWISDLGFARTMLTEKMPELVMDKV